MRRLWIAFGTALAWLVAGGVALACHTTTSVGPPGSVVVWGETRLAGVPVLDATVSLSYRDANNVLVTVSEDTEEDPAHYALAFKAIPGETSKTITLTATYQANGTTYGAIQVLTLTPADLWVAGETLGLFRADLLLDPNITPHPPTVWGRVTTCTGRTVGGMTLLLRAPELNNQVIARDVITPGGEFEFRLSNNYANLRRFTVRLELVDTAGRFAVFDGDTSQEPVWMERTLEWNPQTSLGGLTFNFNDASAITNSNVADRSRLGDLLASFEHERTVVQWIADTLNFDLPSLLRLRLFSGRPVSGYDVQQRTIFFTPQDSLCDDPDRPINREWHETFHHLMSVGLPAGIPPLLPGDVNHGGYKNASTRDSWSEGWATGWSMILADQEGLPQPWLYPINGYKSDLEYDMTPRDPLETLLMTRESFAVAGLLWDLYDGRGRNLDGTVDPATTPPATLWTVMRRARLLDVLDVYSQTVSSAAILGTTPAVVNRLFINHGLYADLNNNATYDSGEQVGRVADGARPVRRDVPPIPGAAMDLRIQADKMPPNTPLWLVVFTDYLNAADNPHDHRFAIPLGVPGQAEVVRRVVLEPPPARTRARVTLQVVSEDGLWGTAPHQVLTIDPATFWAQVARTRPGSAAISHTVTMRSLNYLPMIRKR